MQLMDKVSTLIKSEIEDAMVEVSDLTGTGDHLGILIVSDEFEGKILIDQHQIIMDILKKEFEDELHAVKLKTMTHKKYNEKMNK